MTVRFTRRNLHTHTHTGSQAQLRNLVFLNGELYASGLSASRQIFHFDLGRNRIRDSIESYGGPVWTMCRSPKENIVAVGCEDGRVRLFEQQESSKKLQFLRGSAVTEGRVTSLDFHPNGQVFFCGSADGRIRGVSTSNGRTMIEMIVDRFSASAKQKRHNTESESSVVWSLKVLSDYSVVSADSRGHVQIWDGRSGTLIQSFVTHDADVLTIAVTGDENTIFASGIDSKIMQLAKQKNRWVGSSTSRSHTHDVNTLTLMSIDHDGREVLLSGGVDAKICCRDISNSTPSTTVTDTTTSLKRKRKRNNNFTKKTEKILPFWPGSIVRVVSSSTSDGFLPRGGVLVMSHDTLEVWTLGSTTTSTSLELEDTHQKKLVISNEGVSIVDCDATSGATHVAYVRADGNARVYVLSSDSKPRRCSLPEEIVKRRRCLGVKFFPDNNRLLVVTDDGQLHVLLLRGAAKDSFEMVCTFDHWLASRRASQGIEDVDDDEDFIEQGGSPIEKFDCGNRFVAASDRSGNLHVYDTQSKRYSSTVLTAPSHLTTLRFTPKEELLLVNASNEVRLYCPNVRRFATEWSSGVTKKALRKIRKHPSVFVDAAFDLASPDNIYLISTSGICAILKSDKEETRRCRFIANGLKPLLGAGFVNHNELAAVQTPWFKMLRHLPMPLYRKKYGT